MYYVCATYDDGKFVECNNVTSISYNGTSSLVTVSEENLLTQNIPSGKTLWVKTQNGSYTVRGDGLRVIEIRKE